MALSGESLFGGGALDEVREVPVLTLDVDAEVGLEAGADDAGEGREEGGLRSGGLTLVRT